MRSARSTHAITFRAPPRRVVGALALLLAGSSCAPAPVSPTTPMEHNAADALPPPVDPTAPADPAEPDDEGLAATLELVESWPLETELGQADLADAADSWIAMIDGARERVDFAEFYGASAPDGALEPVIAAIERAAARGVAIRFLFDRSFHAKMPAVPDRLAAIDGVQLRLIDGARYSAEEEGDGVLHAKYFIVDRRELFLGSQNFDWRALEHILELGVRLRHPAVARELSWLFEYDWALAEGAREADARAHASRVLPRPTDEHELRARYKNADNDAEPVALSLVASPRGHLERARDWDLPQLVDAIDGAREQVRVQLLSFDNRALEGARRFNELDAALRRAAARGVRTRLMVAHWSTAEDRVAPLRELQRVPGLEVSFVTIPAHSAGFIPFARVIHSKFLVVDARLAWVGTSNWAREYFYGSRNVGLLVRGEAFARRLARLFDDLWDSSLATRLDPDARYPAPRVAE